MPVGPESCNLYLQSQYQISHKICFVMISKLAVFKFFLGPTLILAYFFLYLGVEIFIALVFNYVSYKI